MKTALILSVLAVVGLLLGCSGNNNPAEPTIPQQLTGTTVTPPLARPENAIRLNSWLPDPKGDGERVYLFGWVKYSIEVGDEISYRSRIRVRVTLSTDAVMSTFTDKEKYTKAAFTSGDGSNFVCCKSTDDVWVPFRGGGMLEKYYCIGGRTDGVKLNLQFVVSDRSVGLQRAWLSLTAATVDPPQD